MTKQIRIENNISTKENIELLNKIQNSFSALEEALSFLKLEEPLFIINVAKKSFANNIYNNLKENQKNKN